MKDMFLGVGTIEDAAAAISFIEAGCDYLISPGLVPNVVEIADENNLTWIPGCMTPTEIIAAESMGAKLVKLFPAHPRSWLYGRDQGPFRTCSSCLRAG